MGQRWLLLPVKAERVPLGAPCPIVAGLQRPKVILAKLAEGLDRPNIDRYSAGRIILTHKQDSFAGEGLVAGVCGLLDAAYTVDAKADHAIHHDYIKIILQHIPSNICDAYR